METLSKLKEKTLKKAAFYLISIAMGLVVPLVFLEVVFNILPSPSDTNNLPVNAQTPYLRHDPNQTMVSSKGWRFQLVTRKHSNNFGYLTDVDFTKDEAAPLLAIIGDSYVEARQVANEHSMHGILGENLKDKGNIYGIGFSGAQLPQYLAFAEFARDKFSPQAMAFVIISNDFDESLRKYRSNPGFHYFVEEQEGLALVRVDFAGHSWLRALAKKSALMRYLVLTAGVSWRQVVPFLNPTSSNQTGFAGNVPAQVSTQRLRDSKKAVDAFLSMLPEMSGLQSRDILFVVDADRASIYSEISEAVGGSFFQEMRAYFIAHATEAGYDIQDMRPLFQTHYDLNGKHFESEVDAHWNELGHSLVADAIRSSRVYENAFER